MGCLRLICARTTVYAAAVFGCGEDSTRLNVDFDGSGETPPDSPALPGEHLFVDGQLLRVELTIDPAALEELDEHGDREEYVAAAVRLSGTGVDAVELAEVGVRHKGSYSLHHCWDDFAGVRSYLADCAKLSLKLKFDRADAEARFDGLKRLNLNAASGDASKLHELMAYRIFRDFGVEAPRAVPAQVYVNGRSRGVFIAVEDVDGRYAQAHYPEGPNGNLYKEVWPNADAPESDFLAALETNEELADVSDLRAFADAISSSTEATFDSAIEPFIDVEAVLRYIAVDRALRNWDGIMAFYARTTPHNFFWYHDDGPESRFHLIPWDLDNTFWAFDPYMHPEQWVTAEPIPDFNVRPLECELRPIWDANATEGIFPPRCDRFLDGLAALHWPRLVELGRELLDGPLALTRLDALADEWIPVLAPVVADDPTLDAAAWQGALGELRDISAGVGPGFEGFLNEGLTAEVQIEGPALLSEAELVATTLDLGLQVNIPMNFEFPGPPAEGIPLGVFTYADPLATISVGWSTEAPLSGNADLRFDFTFNRAPGLYDEWAGVGIAGPEADARRRSHLVLWVSSDVPRQVRVRLLSAAYDEDFGGILPEFGTDHSVGPSPRALVIPLDEMTYPTWAKQLWTTEQGFPGTDAEAFALVMQRFNGVLLSPVAAVDPAGQLSAETETGHLRIDNIYLLSR